MEMDRKALELIEVQKKSLESSTRLAEFDISLDEMFRAVGVKKTIKKEEILYRARIYNKPDVYKKYSNPPKDVFQGYDAEGSLAPPPNIAKAGRCNIDGVSFLYTATDKDGAIAEVRPYANNAVSLAEIKVTEELKIIDLSEGLAISNDEFTSAFTLILNNDFSGPIYDEEDYLLSQYVAGYIKKSGYDGVKYRSALSASDIDETYYKNIVIFDRKNYEAMNSKLFKVNRVKVETNSFDEIFIKKSR